MNHAVVVDASVAVKRLLDEEFTAQTRVLFDDNLGTGTRIVAPHLLISEVANALYQRTRTSVRTRKISDKEAERALAVFSRLPIALVSPADLHAEAIIFARTHGLSNIYDSLYIVLARKADAPLWTDDRKLLQSLGSATPWVRWIGDYRTPQ